MSTRTLARIAIPSLFVIFICGVPVSAQIGWLHPDFERGVMLELFKPSLPHTNNTTFPSAVWMLTGDFPVAPTAAIVTEVSLSHVGFDRGVDFVYYYMPPPNQTAIGNPYVGMEFRGKRSSLFGRVGVRLPMASESNEVAEEFGALTEFARFEAFAPKVTTVSAMFGYRMKMANDPITLRWFLEPAFMIPRSGDPELYSNVSFEFGFHTPRVVGAAGVVGRILWTESDLDFGQRSAFQFGGSLGFNVGNSQIGAHLHVPLDSDWQEFISVSYGLNFIFHYQ